MIDILEAVIKPLLSATNIVIAECDKHRMIDYGRLQAEVKNYESFAKLIDAGRNVRLAAEREGIVDDDYKRD